MTHHAHLAFDGARYLAHCRPVAECCEHQKHGKLEPTRQGTVGSPVAHGSITSCLEILRSPTRLGQVPNLSPSIVIVYNKSTGTDKRTFEMELPWYIVCPLWD